MADGRFDDLPHQGRRLPIEDDAAAGDWALAFRMLRNAGVAPPWIEADKAVRELLEARERLFAKARRSQPASRQRLRAELERLVRDLDRAIARVNAEAPTDRQHRRPLVLADELAQLDAAIATDR
jgi:transposase